MTYSLSLTSDIVKSNYKPYVPKDGEDARRLKYLLFLDDLLRWSMSGSDCGSKYWYNVSRDATVRGTFRNRSRYVSTIGYPIVAFTLYRFDRTYGDYIKVDEEGGKVVFMRVHDIVNFFGDAMSAVRANTFMPEDVAVNSALVTDNHVKLFDNYDVFVHKDYMQLLEMMTSAIWRIARHGIPGLAVKL